MTTVRLALTKITIVLHFTLVASISSMVHDKTPLQMRKNLLLYSLMSYIACSSLSHITKLKVRVSREFRERESWRGIAFTVPPPPLEPPHL